jgi:hypothetical protein
VKIPQDETRSVFRYGKSLRLACSDGMKEFRRIEMRDAETRSVFRYKKC